jgi:SAM-dependent methyltransferase
VTQIPTHVEAKHAQDPDYGGFEMNRKRLRRQRHRKRVGGHWEDLGKLQIEFLREQGLRPSHRMLDVGCGSFRAGRHIVDYLDPGHYYGIDINHDLISTGYDHELTQVQRDRLPVDNLRVTDRFDADFGVAFDMALAQSVFTHVSLNFIRLCLHRVGQRLRPGGILFATFKEARDGLPIDGRHKAKHFQERNPYWYYQDDLRWAAERTPLTFRYLGDWGHPRRQRMVAYTREA